MFAKLFERDGVQVLVTKSNGEENEPTLDVIFEVPQIGKASVSAYFENNEDQAEALDMITEDDAFDIRDAQVDEWKNMLFEH